MIILIETARSSSSFLQRGDRTDITMSCMTELDDCVQLYTLRARAVNNHYHKLILTGNFELLFKSICFYLKQISGFNMLVRSQNNTYPLGGHTQKWEYE